MDNANCKGNHDSTDALLNSNLCNENVVALASTAAHATHYNMNHKNRGHAVIFNHEHFMANDLSSRNGTNVDCENLSKKLNQLGFKVHVCKDFSQKDIKSKLAEIAAEDHTDNDCVLFVVLTHGEEGLVHCKDSIYKADMLWKPFTGDLCPTLAGKPKLFFIQACQGSNLDPGVQMHMKRTETDGHPSNYQIPTQADFLITYSTVPGYYSWRNTTRGSWFVQALYEELNLNAYKEDILSILTSVNRRVAIDFQSCVPDKPYMDSRKQMPCIVSMLTRKLLFTQKGSQVEISERLRLVEHKSKEKGKVFNWFRASKTKFLKNSKFK